MQLNVRVIVITVHWLPTHRIILHNEIVITATVRLMMMVKKITTMAMMKTRVVNR